MANENISQIMQTDQPSKVFRARFERSINQSMDIRIWLFAPNAAIVNAKIEISEPGKNEWVPLTDSIGGAIVELTSSQTYNLTMPDDVDIRWNVTGLTVATPVDPATLSDPDDITLYPSGTVRVGIANV